MPGSKVPSKGSKKSKASTRSKKGKKAKSKSSKASSRKGKKGKGKKGGKGKNKGSASEGGLPPVEEQGQEVIATTDPKGSDAGKSSKSKASQKKKNKGRKDVEGAATEEQGGDVPADPKGSETGKSSRATQKKKGKKGKKSEDAHLVNFEEGQDGVPADPAASDDGEKSQAKKKKGRKSVMKKGKKGSPSASEADDEKEGKGKGHKNRKSVVSSASRKKNRKSKSQKQIEVLEDPLENENEEEEYHFDDPFDAGYPEGYDPDLLYVCGEDDEWDGETWAVGGPVVEEEKKPLLHCGEVVPQFQFQFEKVQTRDKVKADPLIPTYHPERARVRRRVVHHGCWKQKIVEDPNKDLWRKTCEEIALEHKQYNMILKRMGLHEIPHTAEEVYPLREFKEAPDLENCGTRDFLDFYIFPVLLPGIQQMIKYARKHRVFQTKLHAFNPLDYLVEYLHNHNYRFPDRLDNPEHLKDIPFVKEWLKKHPRPPLPRFLTMSDDEAARIIQRAVRGHFTRIRPDIQEMRQFWKDYAKDQEEERLRALGLLDTKEKTEKPKMGFKMAVKTIQAAIRGYLVRNTFTVSQMRIRWKEKTKAKPDAPHAFLDELLGNEKDEDEEEPVQKKFLLVDDEDDIEIPEDLTHSETCLMCLKLREFLTLEAEGRGDETLMPILYECDGEDDFEESEKDEEEEEEAEALKVSMHLHPHKHGRPSASAVSKKSKKLKDHSHSHHSHSKSEKGHHKNSKNHLQGPSEIAV